MLRVLIVGFGDVAQRIARLLRGRARVYALVRGEAARERARSAGAVCVRGDLDYLHKLRRIGGLAEAVIHLAPPPSPNNARPRGSNIPIDSREFDDARTRNLLAALSRRGSVPRRFVYISTSGVYGDHGGAHVTETSRLRTQNGRAWRRVAAERRVRKWAARQHGCARGRAQFRARRASVSVRASILRVPGIYAAERLPLQRLSSGQPALRAQDDVYTNHIHADDLARISILSLFRARHNRVYIASDESEMTMGDYFDRVADAYGLPRAPRLARSEAQRVLSEMALSFMSESRRLSNRRLRQELRVRLRYRSVDDFLAQSRRG